MTERLLAGMTSDVRMASTNSAVCTLGASWASCYGTSMKGWRFPTGLPLGKLPWTSGGVVVAYRSESCLQLIFGLACHVCHMVEA